MNQARRKIIHVIKNLIFGGLAILVICMTVDPLALRPRFSPGLPFSDIYFESIIYGFACFLLIICEIQRYKLVNCTDAKADLTFLASRLFEFGIESIRTCQTASTGQIFAFSEHRIIYRDSGW